MYPEAIVANMNANEVYQAMMKGERSESAIKKLIAYVGDLEDMFRELAQDVGVDNNWTRDPEEIMGDIDEALTAAKKCKEEYEAIGGLIEHYNAGKQGHERIQYDPDEPSAAIAELIERLKTCGG